MAISDYLDFVPHVYLSDYLCAAICKKFDIKIHKYIWKPKLTKTIMKIPLHEFHLTEFKLENSKLPYPFKTTDIEKFLTLENIYKYGFNIGYAELTARHFATYFHDSKVVCGNLPILKGTYLCPNGKHYWLIIGDTIIEPTLRISMNIKEAKKIGFITDYEICNESAIDLSEGVIYPINLFLNKSQISDYQKQLLIINY